MTDQQRKTIIVCKSRTERYALRIMMAAYVLIILTVSYWYGWILMLLLAVPGGLFGLMLLWYEGWSITFRGNTVIRHSWFRETGRYSLAGLTDAVKGYSATDREYISLKFSDGRTLVFRLRDENGKAAMKLVGKYYSLRNPD